MGRKKCHHRYTPPVPHQDAWHSDRIKEECGVIALFTQSDDAARMAFFSLFALQHRGQESAGLAVSDGSRVHMHRGMGLVSQVFNEEVLATLPGHMAIGHTRYSTAGGSFLRNAQPIFCTSIIGDIAVAHNGNLINSTELRRKMEAEGERFDSTADSEVIARLLVRNMHHGPENAVAATMKEIKGAYSVTVITPKMILGFRDPNGIRPLSAGTLKDGFMMASETCAFSPLGGTVTHEVHPGELCIIDEKGMRFAQAAPTAKPSMCMFEFIYFARPDSKMYGTTLYSARERMGEELAKEYPVEADLVIPVPDSGIPAALGYSRTSGIPFAEGMTKSRYIHRTFIQPSQQMREQGVRMKLSPIEDHIRGKKLIVVDDSIVRATTTKQIVKLLFDCGAEEVHVRITAPPIVNPCFYGIDMAKRNELAAAIMTIEEIRAHLGATTLGYLSIDGAVKAVGKPKDHFCLACFNGDYPIGVDEELVKDAAESDPVGTMSGVRTGQMALFDN